MDDEDRRWLFSAPLSAPVVRSVASAPEQQHHDEHDGKEDDHDRERAGEDRDERPQRHSDATT